MRAVSKIDRSLHFIEKIAFMPTLAHEPLPFGENSSPEPVKNVFKIYRDKNNHIARPVRRLSDEPDNSCRDERNSTFDGFYFDGLKKGLYELSLRAYLRSRVLKEFPDSFAENSENVLMPPVEEYLDKNIKRVVSNTYKRKKRFRRKTNLNKWNYFVTFTYDDKKCHEDENEFRRRLRRCLANFHTRRHWKYMGVFERAPETGRLHFHGLFYIPSGEMVGKMETRHDYDLKRHEMQDILQNTFFWKRFGRNDFEEVQDIELCIGNIDEYILKYIGKTNAPLVYSRGVPMEIIKELEPCTFAAEVLYDFVTKFVLFDDVIDWERDVAKFKYRQGTIWDLSPSPR